MTALSFRTPFRFLRGNAVRFALTIFAVACGVALACAIDLANRAVFEVFSETVDTMAGRSALQVRAGQGGLFSEEVASTVAEVPGVELAVPTVSASAFATDGSGEELAVQGIDIANDAAVRVYEPAGAGTDMEDPLVFLSQPDSILLGEEFARKRGLTSNDQLELDTPSGRRRFTIRGLLAPEGIAKVRGGNIIVMDIAAAEAAFTRPFFVNGVDIVVRRDTDVGRLADAVTAVLPPGLSVAPPAQRKVDLHRVMQSIQTLISTVGVLALVAAFLIAFSRLGTVFDARVTRLAVLRAVGIRTRRVWWELAKESLIVGAAGVAIGLPLGIAGAHFLLPFIATTTAISAKLPFAEASLSIRPAALALAAALGLAAVLVAAALPAWRAAQVSVVEVLHCRGGMQQSLAKASWQACALVAMAALAAWGVHFRTGSALFGIVGSGLSVVLAALAARPLLLVLERPLGWLVAKAGPSGRLAFATLVGNPRRTALAISTIGVGFGTVLWLWTIARSFEQSVIEVMPGVLRGDLAVSSTNIGAGYIEAPIDDAIVEALARIPGIARVAGEQATDWRYENGPIAINAFDADYFSEDWFGRWPLIGRQLPGAWESVARGEAVVVSENFVRNLHVTLGDMIILDTPNGALALRVAGVTRDFLSPRGTIEMSRALYKRYWNDSHLIRALVKTAPDSSADAVREEIARALGREYSLQILTIGSLVDWFTAQVRRAFGGLHILAALILVVVLVGVGDSLAAGIVERTRELGIVRAAGVRRRYLARVVLLEALVLAGLGLAVAVVTGLALGLVWVKSTFPALLGWTLSLHIPGIQLLGVTVAVFAVCLLGALLPTLRATRLDPVVALRSE